MDVTTGSVLSGIFCTVLTAVVAAIIRMRELKRVDDRYEDQKERDGLDILIKDLTKRVTSNEAKIDELSREHLECVESYSLLKGEYAALKNENVLLRERIQALEKRLSEK